MGVAEKGRRAVERGVRLREGAGDDPLGRAGASKGGLLFFFFLPHSFISIAINNPFPRSCPDSN